MLTPDEDDFHPQLLLPMMIIRNKYRALLYRNFQLAGSTLWWIARKEIKESCLHCKSPDLKHTGFHEPQQRILLRLELLLRTPQHGF